MALHTTNYNLEKQQGNEFISIDGLNENFDIIDDAVASKADRTEIPESLPANGGNSQTVNGKTVESNVPVNAVFTDTVYSHPTSGVTAGTFHSVTVDTKGHVTAGSNPNTTVAQGGTGATTASGALTNLGALPIAGGTMTGNLIANGGTDYTTAEVRNILFGTTIPSAVTSGYVYMMYE